MLTQWGSVELAAVGPQTVAACAGQSYAVSAQIAVVDLAVVANCAKDILHEVVVQSECLLAETTFNPKQSLRFGVVSACKFADVGVM